MYFLRKMQKTKLIFFGTSYISAFCLESFIKDDFYDLAFCVTKKGSYLNRYCARKNIKCLEIECINQDIYKKVQEIEPDLFAVVDFGFILKEDFFAIPKKGAYNLHFSLLPLYRGASPVQSAIYDGVETSGVSVIEIIKELDAGAVIAQKKVSIKDLRADKTFEEMLKVGAPLFAESLKDPQVLFWQDESQATFCHKIKKQDGKIDIEQDSAELALRKINAFYPWPGVFLFDQNLGRIKLHRAELSDKKGRGFFKNQNELYLGFGENSLKILEIQREGKKAMSGQDFSKGLR